MNADYEEPAKKLTSNGRKTEQGALESAESHLARSAGTGDPRDGRGEAFSASFSALLQWGEEHKLIREEREFDFFLRKPDGHGDEHEAWFDEASNRWFKATYPNRFGLAWGRQGTATPQEYLTRLVLQNRYFGDKIRLEALVNCSQKLRVLTSQPHIAGGPATPSEIKQWFLDLDFKEFHSGDSIAWYRQQENLLVADAHEGNIIKTAEGILVPIDLNIMQPARDDLLEILQPL